MISLLLLWLALNASDSFNIDTKPKVVFEGDKQSLFGQNVLQYQVNDKNWILISSPLYTENNKAFGKMERCSVKECSPFIFKDEKANIRPGFTTALDSFHSKILMCRQQRQQLKRNTEDLNGICSFFSSELQPNNYFSPAELDGGMEIAIVLDGSGSIEPEDFQKAKAFIVNIITNIWKVCFKCEFALVQFGEEIETIFDLNESRRTRSGVFSIVKNMTQLGKVTKTASAIQHVLDQIFTEENGSKANAKKVIVVVTDGDIYRDPLNINDVVNSTKMENVERFAIGVGYTTKKEKAMKELKVIASDPDEKHLFSVDNYSALDGLLENLGKNIVGIEDGGMEIAIVLDGSGSIKSEDFQTAIQFIVNIIKNIWKVCFECEFALVQYGQEIETIFDLNESRRTSSGIFSIIKNMSQLGKVTKTASAIQHVLDQIFTAENGSKANAKKFIVVVTDGDIYRDPLNINDVVNSTKMEHVERFAIGVGNATKKEKAMKELKVIASDPDEKHLFSVDNYSALDGLLENLEKIIVGIEGTQGSFEMQLAQAGFSAQYTQDGNILIGAVGAYDWAGGVIKYNENTQEVQFLNESKPSEDTTYSYLGYSVAAVQGVTEVLYIAGAPRYSQTGQVLVFETGSISKIKQRLLGKQLGSYFGSELCALDVNKDNITDYLLVGAPFYHKRGEEGMVYLYHLNEMNQLEERGNLSGLHHFTRARFGFAIANIGDVNQDGYSDIAIGAPLEEDSAGSIYIFNGDQENGLQTHSQRISGKDVKPGLQYFGQSISGATDWDADGFMDITVGSMGAVVVLSSRPVINVNVNMRFSPETIPLFTTHQEQEHLINATVCFATELKYKGEVTDLTNTYAKYTVTLDTKQKIKRVKFTKNENPYTSSGSVTLSSNVCEAYTLTLQQCTTDCVSDIDVEVNFTMHHTEEDNKMPLPILDKFNDKSIHFQLPFQKDCGPDNICHANLGLALGFSPESWVIGKTKEVTMEVRLSNEEASYFTTMEVSHPDYLNFKLSKSTNATIKCNTDATAPSSSLLTCLIAHPVLKNRSSTVFFISWDLESREFEGNSALINISVSNKNGAKDGPIQQSRHIHLKHAVNVQLVSRNKTKVIFSDGKWNMEKAYLTFEVDMKYSYNAKVNLSILIPVEIKGLSILKLELSKNTSMNCFKIKGFPESQRNKTLKDVWDCDEKEHGCQRFNCQAISSSGKITIEATLSLDNIKRLVEHQVDIVATGQISIHGHLYEKISTDQLHKAKVHVSIEKKPIFRLIPLVIGSSVAGLVLLLILIIILYKCGFFKRSYKDMKEMQEGTED